MLVFDDFYLVETTQFIDSKIESIFKIAIEEESDSSAHEQTTEFLEQLIEVIEDLCWLVLRVSEELRSRNLMKKYKNGYEAVLEVIMGVERIYRGIRRGTSGLPRNRDYATENIFKNIQITALDDAKEQWSTWIDELRDSNEELKWNSRYREGKIFEQKCVRVLTVTLTALKKIKLKCFNEYLKDELCDDLIELGETIVPIAKDSTRLLLIHSHSSFQICDQMFKLDTKLNELIELLELTDDEWFMNCKKEMNLMCEKISAMNPMR